MKAAGVLTRLSLAWSRDASEKFYVRTACARLAAISGPGSRWRPCLCLRRRQAHGARRRGRAGRDRRPARVRSTDERSRLSPASRRPARYQQGRCIDAGCRGERRPAQAGTPRMEPLARLPVFLALAGKRAVVAGNWAGGGVEGRVVVRGGRPRSTSLRIILVRSFGGRGARSIRRDRDT